jgi:hypothetical protein
MSIIRLPSDDPLVRQFSHLGDTAYLIDASRGIDLGNLASVVSKLVDQWHKASLRFPSENIPPYAPLSNDQLKRAEALWWSRERVQKVRNLAKMSQDAIWDSLDSSKVKKGMDYITDILNSLVSRERFDISRIDIPRDDIQILIDRFFLPKNREYHIPCVLPYFYEKFDTKWEDHRLNIRYTMGLLDFWRALWRNHELFGLLPDESMDHFEEMDIFSSYTAYRDTGKWLYSVPSFSHKHLIIWVDYEVDLADQCTDVFPMLGMHKGAEQGIEMDIEHYETIYMLGWTIYDIIKPTQKWLMWFIKRHFDILSRAEKLPWTDLPIWKEWAWQGAKKIMEQLKYKKSSTTSQKISKKPNKPKWTPRVVDRWNNQQNTLPTPLSSLGEAYIIYQHPTINPDFSARIQSPLVDILRQAIAPNILPDQKLWIGEPFMDKWWQKGTRWTPYASQDTISLGAIDFNNAVYQFCIGSEDDTSLPPEKYSPRTRVTVTRIKPKLIPELSSQSKALPPKPIDISIWVQKATEVVLSNPMQDLVVDLLIQLDEQEPKYGLVSYEKDITLTFSGESGIQARYELSTWSIVLMGWDRTYNTQILDGIRDELMRVFQSAIKNIDIQKQEREILKKKQIQDRLWSISDTLNTLLSDLDTSHTVSDIVGLLMVSRKNGYSSAGLFAQDNYAPLWNAFHERCKQQGIYVKLARIDNKKETIITVSLHGEPGISGTIQTYDVGKVSPDDKVTLEQLAHIQFDKRLVDADIQRTLSQVLVSLLSTLSFAANQILEIPLDSEKKSENLKMTQRTNRSSYLDQAFSLQYIHDLLAGRISRQYKSWDRLSSEQKSSVEHAIKRLDRGEGRQFLSGGFNETTGYYTCQVQSRRTWSDLQDTDQVVIHDERIMSVPRWGKWNPHIYDMIRSSERHPKYLILKMVATILGKPFRNKRPFTNGIKEHFDKFWSEVSPAKKEEFLKAVTLEWSGKAGEGLRVILEDGSRLFDTFIKWAEAKNITIQLRYSRPQHLSVADLIVYRPNIKDKHVVGAAPDEIED